MGRRLVVSDVHGEWMRLAQALRQAGYRPDQDRLFLLGDYIDRGSDSRGTVTFVKRLVAGGAVALRGNHDVMPGIVARDPSRLAWWINNGGDTTMRDYDGMLPPDDVIEWLEHLPLYHEEPDCILVHAGLAPGVPLDQQAERTLLWAREEFYRTYRGKLVVFGHTPTILLHERKEPWAYGDLLGIDTGAIWGGPLTLLDLDSRETWMA